MGKKVIERESYRRIPFEELLRCSRSLPDLTGNKREGGKRPMKERRENALV